MKKNLLLIASLILGGGATYSDFEVPLSQTGIDDANLADTTYSNPIHMRATEPSNQLSLTLAVTAGTSALVHVLCQERGSALEEWQPIMTCDSSAEATCGPDTRVYTLSEYTAVSGVIWLTSNWWVRKRFARCVADDPADGTGTVDMTGWRSWQ